MVRFAFAVRKHIFCQVHRYQEVGICLREDPPSHLSPMEGSVKRRSRVSNTHGEVVEIYLGQIFELGAHYVDLVLGRGRCLASVFAIFVDFRNPCLERGAPLWTLPA